jgi:sigma54-dependent transcription regulator
LYIKKNNTPEIKISYNKRKTNVWVDIFIKFSKDVFDMVILNESNEFSLDSIEDEINQLENKLIELKKQKQIYKSIIL